MALWKDPTVKDPAAAPADAPGTASEPAARAERPAPTSAPAPTEIPRRPAPGGAAAKESLIAGDVTIEGKIEGGCPPDV